MYGRSKECGRFSVHDLVLAEFDVLKTLNYDVDNSHEGILAVVEVLLLGLNWSMFDSAKVNFIECAQLNF
jgi:hypothetical protein